MNVPTSTTPTASRMHVHLSPMRRFDPVEVAHFEKEAWVAYYQHKWVALLRQLIGLVRSTYGLTLLQAMRVGVPLTRAQMAFAPQDNDVPKAIEYMRQFFAYVKEKHGEELDPAEAALAEVSWWMVHRKFFGHSDQPEVIEAVVCAYVAAYRADPALVREAAYHRAQAMVYSDAWVLSERDPKDPRLQQEEDELVKSYAALKKAVSQEIL